MKLLSLSQAAKNLGVHPDKVKAWILCGDLKAKKSGSRYKTSDKWLDEMTPDSFNYVVGSAQKMLKRRPMNYDFRN